MENGTAPLSGWVLAQVGSLTLVARCQEPGHAEEAYELRPMLGTTERGLQRDYRCFPLFLLADVAPFQFSLSLVIDGSTLTLVDQKTIRHAVESARELQAATKAAQSPIAVARVLPKGLKP